jgi:short subunit fatty acids transporter
MEFKQETNTNQESMVKKTSNNANATDDIKENTISEIPSLNKIFSNANSIIMPNVIYIILIIQNLIKFKKYRMNTNF